VQRAWSQAFFKKHKLFNVVRARIALRKEGIIPPSSTDPDAEDTLIQTEVKAIRKKVGKNITEDDVIAAFSRGDEV